LPFKDNTINFILTTLSLHHWSDPVKSFKEIIRVLKPEGHFLIFDFRRDARKLYYWFFKFITKVIVPKPLKRINEPLGSALASYTPEEVKEMLSKLEIKEINITPAKAWMFIEGVK